jgi:hypothetical protein
MPTKTIHTSSSGPILSIDATALARVTEYLSLPSLRASKSLQSFVNTVQQIGPVWGNGQIGSQIESQYRPGFNDLLTLLKGLAEGFDAVGSKFTVAARNVLLTEEVNQT